jgi:hypothetical protein
MITTTHARPSLAPPSRFSLSAHVTFCSYCTRPLGMASTAAETAALHRKHTCSEKRIASQPAICVPFS